MHFVYARAGPGGVDQVVSGDTKGPVRGERRIAIGVVACHGEVAHEAHRRALVLSSGDPLRVNVRQHVIRATRHHQDNHHLNLAVVGERVRRAGMRFIRD